MSLTDGEEGGDLDIPVEAPEERMTERMTLYQILHTLEERDQKLIRCRYFQGKTQSQTAAELGMTQVQVSRREKSCWPTCAPPLTNRKSALPPTVGKRGGCVFYR